MTERILNGRVVPVRHTNEQQQQLLSSPPKEHPMKDLIVNPDGSLTLLSAGFVTFTILLLAGTFIYAVHGLIAYARQQRRHDRDAALAATMARHPAGKARTTQANDWPQAS